MNVPLQLVTVASSSSPGPRASSPCINATTRAVRSHLFKLNHEPDPLEDLPSCPSLIPSFFDMSSAAEEDSQRVDSMRRKALVLEEMMQQATGSRQSSEGEVCMSIPTSKDLKRPHVLSRQHEPACLNIAKA